MNSKLSLLTFFQFLFLSAYAQISWTPIGPGGGGWLTAITVVNDNANTVYVSCDVGGIYKSQDHGANWEIFNEGLTSYDVSDIAYDPTNPLTLYLASRGGVFKSTDGGAHWVAKRNGFPDEAEFSYSAPIGSIEVDPLNPQTVYAGVGIVREGYFGLTSDYWVDSGTKGTIFRSTNGGASWQPLTVDPDATAMILGITIDPKTTSILYATTSEGIYKSTDSGDSWAKIGNGLPHDLTMNLIINPDNTDILHATLWALPGATWHGGVYKSTNGGIDWSSITNNLPKSIHATESGLTSNYVNILANKSNPDIMYVGNPSWADGGVYKTDNGGSSWSFITETEENNVNTNTGWIKDGVATECMAIDPSNPNRIYAGSPKVIIMTADAGTQWEQIYTNPVVGADGYWKGRGFQTTVIGDIAIDPVDGNNLYVGYWDMGFQKSMDGGISFKNTFMDEQTIAYKENVFAIVVDPTNTDIIYASTGWWNTNEGELVKSTDGGESWTAINDNILPKKQIWSLALDKNSPANARVLYAAVFEEGVFKSSDGGQTWSAINNGLGVGDNKRIRKIIVDPNDSKILFAGFEPKNDYDAETTQQGGLFKSTDAGETWIRIDDPINLPQMNIQDIAIDPNNSQHVYTAIHTDYDHSKGNTYFGGVYKSEDGGSTWTKFNSGFGQEQGLKVHTVIVSPSDGDILYAGTNDSPYHDNSSGRGIFKSIDGGQSWSQINDGVGALYIEKLFIDPSDPSTLYAGTGGNGLLKATDEDILLPIETLEPLSATITRSNQVLLQWATASETNNNGFEIQRSGADLTFKKIDFIPGTNINSPKTYRVLDPSPLAQNYYRYKQIDLDGQYSFSNIVFARLSKNTFKISPNIVTDGQLNFHLELNNRGKGNLEIYTAKGVPVFAKDLGILQKGKTNTFVTIELPAGYYYAIVRLGGEQVIQEFLVKS